jgi:hypothetical protein
VNGEFSADEVVRRIASAQSLLLPIWSLHYRESRCQPIDVIEKLHSPGVPVHCITFLEGGVFVLLHNLDTTSGLAQEPRCSATDLRNRTVIRRRDDGSETALTRMLMEKMSNGRKFKRWPIFVRLKCSGTVHRLQ